MTKKRFLTKALVRADDQFLAGPEPVLSAPAAEGDAVSPSADLPLGRAMLIDDDPVSNATVQEILDGFGVEADLSGIGMAPLQLARAHHYPLVIIDLQLPATDGIQLVKTFRALEKQTGGRRATVLAITATDSAFLRRKCYQAGVDEVLVKPVRPEQLGRHINFRSPPTSPPERSAPPVAPELHGEGGGEAALWDRTKALDLVGGDEPLFCEMAMVFLNRNELLLQRLETAIDHGDADDLLAAAHAYKGAVGHFACPVLEQSARILEELAREGRIDGRSDHLALLREKSAALCRELSRLIMKAAGD